MKELTRRHTSERQSLPLSTCQPQTRLARSPGYQYNSWFVLVMIGAALGIYVYPGTLSTAELAFIQWSLSSAIYLVNKPLHNNCF